METVTVRMSRSDPSTPWGFRLQGGLEFSAPLSIGKVAAGSLSDRAGLREGDHVGQIGGYAADTLSHKDAQNCIVSCGNNLDLIVERSSGGQIWKPSIIPLDTPSHPLNGVPSEPPSAPVKYSLEHRQQDSLNIGSGYNLTPKPFSSVAPPRSVPYNASPTPASAPASAPAPVVVQPAGISPRGGGGGGSGTTVQHLQYNSPAGLYSGTSATDAYLQQTGGLFGTDPNAVAKTQQNNYKSATWQMIHDSESQDRKRGPPAQHPDYAVGRDETLRHTQEVQSSSFNRLTSAMEGISVSTTATREVTHVEEAPQPHVEEPVEKLSEIVTSSHTSHVAAPTGPPPGSAPPPTGGGAVCDSCGRTIIGVFCKAGGRTLHAECFNCTTCGSSLKHSGYFLLGDKLYCEVHAKQRQKLGLGVIAPVEPKVVLTPLRPASPPRSTGSKPFYQTDIMQKGPVGGTDSWSNRVTTNNTVLSQLPAASRGIPTAPHVASNFGGSTDVGSHFQSSSVRSTTTSQFSSGGGGGGGGGGPPPPSMTASAPDMRAPSTASRITNVVWPPPVKGRVAPYWHVKSHLSNDYGPNGDPGDNRTYERVVLFPLKPRTVSGPTPYKKGIPVVDNSADEGKIDETARQAKEMAAAVESINKMVNRLQADLQYVNNAPFTVAEKKELESKKPLGDPPVEIAPPFEEQERKVDLNAESAETVSTVRTSRASRTREVRSLTLAGVASGIGRPEALKQPDLESSMPFQSGSIQESASINTSTRESISEDVALSFYEERPEIPPTPPSTARIQGDMDPPFSQAFQDSIFSVGNGRQEYSFSQTTNSRTFDLDAAMAELAVFENETQELEKSLATHNDLVPPKPAPVAVPSVSRRSKAESKINAVKQDKTVTTVETSTRVQTAGVTEQTTAKKILDAVRTPAPARRLSYQPYRVMSVSVSDSHLADTTDTKVKQHLDEAQTLLDQTVKLLKGEIKKERRKSTFLESLEPVPPPKPTVSVKPSLELPLSKTIVHKSTVLSSPNQQPGTPSKDFSAHIYADPKSVAKDTVTTHVETPGAAPTTNGDMFYRTDETPGQSNGDLPLHTQESIDEGHPEWTYPSLEAEPEPPPIPPPPVVNSHARLKVSSLLNTLMGKQSIPSVGDSGVQTTDDTMSESEPLKNKFLANAYSSHAHYSGSDKYETDTTFYTESEHEKSESRATSQMYATTSQSVATQRENVPIQAKEPPRSEHGDEVAAFMSRTTVETTGNRVPRRGKGILKSVQDGAAGRVPVCEQCHREIRGPYVAALSKFWCPDHFACGNPSCHRKLLEVGFIEENGQIYCEFCFEKYFAPICAKCSKPVVGDCLNAINCQWHPECFTCFQCHQQFGNATFFLEDGKPYCEKDWNQLFTTKCGGCQFPIEAGDRWVEALGSAYHSDCFTCTLCHKNLEGLSFYAKGGRPYCKAHA